MKKVLPALFVLLLTMWGSTAVAQIQTGKRVALVIGNAAYASFGKLDNPSNDAEDIAAILRQIGFTVIEGRDLSRRDMDRRLAQFSRAASDAETAVVYYAGHGLQYQNQNFLVPTDAQLKDGFDIPFETISVDSVIGALDNSRGARIMILDACRNLPLTEGVKRGSGTGLARVVGRDGLIIAYATQSNQVAFDGQGRNSPYAEALAKSLAESGLEVGQVFQRVAVAVKKATQGKQLPEFSRSYADEVFLNRAETDAQAWSRLRDSNVVADLSAFIEKFPASFLADAARIRIQLLESQARYAEQEERRAQEERRQEDRRAQERLLWARREEEQNHREQARLSVEKSRREEEQNQAELARLMAQRQDEEARREAIRREERARQEQARLEAEKAARIAVAEILRREEAARLARQEQAREQAKVEAEKAARLAAIEQKRRDEAARVEQARIEQARVEAEKAAQVAAAEQARRDEAARVELARQEQARIEQARADAEKAARLAALEQKRRDEAARIEQAKIEQARVEAEKAARLAALEQARRDEITRQEQAKAEKAAQVAAAERQRREDAARLEQAKAEAARVAAAERQRRDDVARQEQARAEQARIEQAKAEQMRVEAEKAARLAAVEQKRREEAAHAEQAKAEAARFAAAEQLRREETARAEQQRIASEAAAQVAASQAAALRQEQARQAADAEAVRVAALSRADDERLAPRSDVAAVVDSKIAAAEPVPASGGFALSADAAKSVVSPADRAPASQADTAKLPHTAYASLDSKEVGVLKAKAPGDPGEVQSAVQRRLTELGCYTEPPEASWGRHSMVALDRFYAAARRADQAKTDQAKTDQAKAELTGNGLNRSIRIASTLPDQLTLDDLNSYSGRICPMICPTGSEQQGEVCVRVTCPNGTVLSDSVCLPRKAAPVAVDPAPRIRKAARPVEIEEDVRPARKAVAPPVEREVRRPAPREVVRPAPREAARPVAKPTYKIVAPVRAAPKVPAVSTDIRSAPVRATASSAPSVTPAEIGAVRAMSRMP